MATDAFTPLTRAGRSALLRGIYCIVDGGAVDPRSIAEAALGAGIRILQYRAKSGVDRTVLRDLRAHTRGAGALLILNDDWRAAAHFGCDGVHLGPDDEGFSDCAPIRKSCPELLVGVSCGTVAEARQARVSGVDYIGVGAVFATASKDDAGLPIGIEGLRDIVAASGLPVAAIGGIDAARLPAVAQSGAAMAAVISAIGRADDPAFAASRLVAIWAASRADEG